MNRREAMEKYADEVIATALHNGMTPEEIEKASVYELTRAHLDCQLRALQNHLDELEEKIENS